MPDSAVVDAGKIILAGTLDTKGEEILFLRDRLSEDGLVSIVVDLGTLGKPHFRPDVPREEILQRAGSTPGTADEDGERGGAVARMQRGLVAWTREYADHFHPTGMIGIGGSAGTSMITAAMRSLPIGVPKLMVSTMASGNVHAYVGVSDICMMHSVIDFTGLNRLSKTILENAAGAMAGMYRSSQHRSPAEEHTLLGATMFGLTTPCVNRVKELLERQGYELLVFHATGTGGDAMEQLIEDGFIKGVLDITTTEFADRLVGGILAAGPERLSVAGRNGVPQVVSVGALDMVNFGAPDTIPSQFEGRNFYKHNPMTTLMRTTQLENEHLGKIIAEKLNAANGPVVVILPLRGISGLDAEGKAFYDLSADKRLFDSIRKTLDKRIRLVEMDCHINDPKFADCIVAEFLAIATPTTPIGGRVPA